VPASSLVAGALVVAAIGVAVFPTTTYAEGGTQGSVAVDGNEIVSGAATTEWGPHKSVTPGPGCEYRRVTDPWNSPLIINGVEWHAYERILRYPDCPPGLVAFPSLTGTELANHLAIMFDANRVPSPAVEYQPLDSQYGWAYVRVPLDIRVRAASIAPVIASSRVDGPAGEAWAEVTATPKLVQFIPGDNDTAINCSVSAVLAPYDPQTPGDCTYTYLHESSTAPNGVSFPASVSVVWAVAYQSSDGNGTFADITTTTTTQLEVAAVKALVTCTGQLPQQGGC